MLVILGIFRILHVFGYHYIHTSTITSKLYHQYSGYPHITLPQNTPILSHYCRCYIFRVPAKFKFFCKESTPVSVICGPRLWWATLCVVLCCAGPEEVVRNSRTQHILKKTDMFCCPKTFIFFIVLLHYNVLINPGAWASSFLFFLTTAAHLLFFGLFYLSPTFVFYLPFSSPPFLPPPAPQLTRGMQLWTTVFVLLWVNLASSPQNWGHTGPLTSQFLQGRNRYKNTQE